MTLPQRALQQDRAAPVTRRPCRNANQACRVTGPAAIWTHQRPAGGAIDRHGQANRAAAAAVAVVVLRCCWGAHGATAHRWTPAGLADPRARGDAGPGCTARCGRAGGAVERPSGTPVPPPPSSLPSSGHRPGWRLACSISSGLNSAPNRPQNVPPG